jgi:acyl-CoA synthetase (NDP forming)
MESIGNVLIDIRQNALKPVMLITPSATIDGMQRAREITQKLHEAGVPVFASFERAARALRNAREYYRFKNGISAQT